MTSNRFFVKSENVHEASAVVEEEEHHHLKNVVRINPGDVVGLFDEAGFCYSARVETIGKCRTRLSVMKRERRPVPKVEITLAQAVVKTKILELVLQKATELGISAFIPVLTERTQVKIGERRERKWIRWTKIVREAAKQSGISFLPDVSEPLPLGEVLDGYAARMKFFLNEEGGKPLREFLVPADPGKNLNFPPPSLIILIGPEGGWTEKEREDIVDHGFEAVSLGRQILRAETAAISSLAMINHFWNP